MEKYADLCTGSSQPVLAVGWSVLFHEIASLGDFSAEGLSMRTTFKVLMIGVMCAAFAITGATAAQAKVPPTILNGRVYVGEVEKEGQTVGDKDEFIFQDGTFRSIACDRYGFGSADFSISQYGFGTIGFRSKTSSTTDGEIDWHGTIRGEALEGTATWTKPGQVPQKLRFRGTLKK